MIRAFLRPAGSAAPARGLGRVPGGGRAGAAWGLRLWTARRPRWAGLSSASAVWGGPHLLYPPVPPSPQPWLAPQARGVPPAVARARGGPQPRPQPRPPPRSPPAPPPEPPRAGAPRSRAPLAPPTACPKRAPPPPTAAARLPSPQRRGHAAPPSDPRRARARAAAGPVLGHLASGKRAGSPRGGRRNSSSALLQLTSPAAPTEPLHATAGGQTHCITTCWACAQAGQARWGGDEKCWPDVCPRGRRAKERPESARSCGRAGGCNMHSGGGGLGSDAVSTRDARFRNAEEGAESVALQRVKKA